MLFAKGASSLDTTSRRTAVVMMAIIIALVAVAVSTVIQQDELTALYAVLGIVIFIFAFLNTDFALAVLILSMLLSPEFGAGSAGGAGQMAHRSVVVRVDDLVLGIITLSWLVKMAVDKNLGLFVRTPLNRPVFLYLGVSVFSTLLGVFTGEVRPLIGILYNVKYFQYFLIFLMVSNHVRDLTAWNRYVRLILVTGFIVAIYAMAQIPTGERVTAPFEGEGGEANTLGGYLVIIIALVTAMLAVSRKLRRVLGLSFFLVALLVPLAYTLSRSAWIALLPMMAALVFYSPGRRGVVIAIIALAATIPVVLPEAVYERISYTFAQENLAREDVVTVAGTALDPSTSARLLSWASTLEQWAQKPVFGWGVTGAGFKDAQYFRVLVETGIVGFAAFLYMLYVIHREARRALRKISAKHHPRYHAIVVGYIAGYWGLLIHAIGANTFIIVRIMEPFWFLTALVLMLPGLLAGGAEAAPDGATGHTHIENETSG